MLTGDVFYFLLAGDGSVGPVSNGGFDRDVTAAYARRASRNAKNQCVRWSCTNGDPRDVRWYQDGIEVTDEVCARDAAERRASAKRQLEELTRPRLVHGVRVQLRYAGSGLVSLDLGGVVRTYAPEEIRAKAGLDDIVGEDFAEMRKRAQKIVQLTEVQS